MPPNGTKIIEFASHTLRSLSKLDCQSACASLVTSLPLSVAASNNTTEGFVCQPLSPFSLQPFRLALSAVLARRHERPRTARLARYSLAPLREQETMLMHRFLVRKGLISPTEPPLSATRASGQNDLGNRAEVSPHAPCRNRTYNLVIKSHLLCQLS